MEVGAWTVHDCITADDMAIFNTAMKGLIGVNYEPIILATQLVNGTNYSFICKTTIMNEEMTKGIAEVIIYKPLKGDPVVTGIHKIK
jgi:hypothetical protein